MEKVKEIHKTKLQADLAKYCSQIGIKETPCLIFNPNEYVKRIEDYYKGKATGKTIKRVKSKGAGRCHEQSKTIFLNQNCRGYSWEFDRNKNGEKVRVHIAGDTYFRRRKTKIDYRWWKKVLIHELVHYRFTKMQHGAKFEKRVMEILRGRVFPECVTSK